MSKTVVFRPVSTGLGDLTVKAYKLETHLLYSNAGRENQVNGGSETAAEETTRKGTYIASITDGGPGDLDGPHLMQLFDSNSNWIGDWYADMSIEGTAALPVLAANSLSAMISIYGYSIGARSLRNAMAFLPYSKVNESFTSPSTTGFDTDISVDLDRFTDQGLVWVTGDNVGITSRIISYSYTANNLVHLTLSQALPDTPSTGDEFQIIGRME